MAFSQSAPPAQPVWQIQDSGTSVSLRGIYSVDGLVAWASGTRGTVLKTIDGGANWQKCTVPDVEGDGVMLDFRGVQAWDAQTAIVMASGPGARAGSIRPRTVESTGIFSSPTPTRTAFGMLSI